MCLFCDIANDRLSTTKVYQDEILCVFPDIAPKAPTHLLVIPKIHITDLRDLDSPEKKEAVGHLILEIPHIIETLQIRDFQLLARNGKDAGQEISHLHFHILSDFPYFSGM